MEGAKIYAPLGFAMVDKGIYRSAYPAEITLPFIRTLHLKSMVCLCGSELKSELAEFAKSSGIKLFSIELKPSIEPFQIMSESTVKEVLEFMRGIINVAPSSGGSFMTFITLLF